jgi:hypothetical protein
MIRNLHLFYCRPYLSESVCAQRCFWILSFRGSSWAVSEGSRAAAGAKWCSWKIWRSTGQIPVAWKCTNLKCVIPFLCVKYYHRRYVDTAALTAQTIVVLTPRSPLATVPTWCFVFCATILCGHFCTVLNPDSSKLNILAGVKPILRHCFPIDQKHVVYYPCWNLVLLLVGSLWLPNRQLSISSHKCMASLFAGQHFLSIECVREFIFFCRITC